MILNLQWSFFDFDEPQLIDEDVLDKYVGELLEQAKQAG